MNRRDFTRSLAALSLAPLAPSLPAIAAAPVPAPTFTPYMYGLAAHLARSTGLCSVGMLSQQLAVSPATARAMQAQLIRSGVISAPNAAGMAVAARPYMTSIRFKSGAVVGKSVRRYLHRLASETPTAGTHEDTPDPA
ncbi:hypothetical protein AAFO92_12605 [Roseovarius sp. CAU 1744]|uniref:hypothetical protein n=1 Tax=Roseovarius sp. CAU 1744 TaxID=3140368 RepID=UPI00325BA979